MVLVILFFRFLLRFVFSVFRLILVVFIWVVMLFRVVCEVRL